MKRWERIKNLEAAAEWLLESQMHTSDNGYSAYFDIKTGWSNSYPETTGYIIPTMFKLGRIFGKKFTDSAIRAADWLVDIQHKDGSYQGGLIGEKRYPVVFNTGQILFGLSAAYKHIKNKKYSKAIEKILRWLTNIQSADGAWRRLLTKKGSGEFQIYYTRVAWGILEGAKILRDNGYYKSAIMNLNFSCRFQRSNGWFERTDLQEKTNNEPLMHFLAYTVEGLLEGGIFLRNKRYIDVARKTSDALLELQEKNGSLRARYDARWQPTVKWSCLTGIAQIAIVWLRLYEILKIKKYFKSGVRANDFLAQQQLLDTDNLGARGGIAGSYPLSGGYEPHRYLNWAIKFFIDSLLLERRFIK